MKVETSSIKAPHRQLVIFEGIMGSGKSTSTRWLGQRLAARDIDAAILTERQYPHPLRATDFAAEWFKPWLDMTPAERGEELGVRYQVDWKLKYAYAVERGLEGLNGLSALYADYRVLTDELFAQLTIDKIAIENSARGWPMYSARIEEALGF